MPRGQAASETARLVREPLGGHCISWISLRPSAVALSTLVREHRPAYRCFSHPHGRIATHDTDRDDPHLTGETSL